MKDKRIIFQILIFTALFVGNVAEDFDNCFASKENYKCRLGSMTPYRLIANHNDSELHYAGCTPKKIWLFVRHGTRYPGKKWTSRMTTELPIILESLTKSHASGGGKLSGGDIVSFEKWKLGFSKEDVMNLAAEGESELVGIAERFQSRFPSIIPEIYSNETHRFKYTSTRRTEESAKNFALGLFGRKQSLAVWYPPPEYRDPVLRFYKLCKRWRDEVDKSPEAYREKEKLVKSPTVDNLLAEVSEMAGFKLDWASVHLIYMICAFETAWRENSPWCSLFSLDNFKVLEFAQDLQYYWVDGYGYPLTYQQACNAMRDVFDYFESEDGVTTRAYFTHSGALLKMLALLGIAKEEKALRHDSFDRDNDRVWRTSLIDSFAANIAFILYDCEARGPSILFMHQERAVKLDGCPEDTPCPLSIMKKKYPDHETECPFDEMCAN